MFMKKSLFTLFFLSLGSFLCAQEAQAAPAKQSNFMQTFFILALAIVFFYFILWRPEQKRRKAATALRERMKKGDTVTAMGIIGTIAQVKDNTVVVKMVDGAKIEFLKAAITDVKAGEEESSSEEKK
jgi:preprotein translocase subunit YajC